MFKNILGLSKTKSDEGCLSIIEGKKSEYYFEQILIFPENWLLWTNELIFYWDYT